MFFPRALISGLTLLAFSPAVFAHDPGLSIVQGHFRADTFEISAEFAPADAAALSLSSDLVARGRQLWSVQAGGRTLEAGDVRVDRSTGDYVRFTLLYPRPAGVNSWAFAARDLARLPGTHRQLVNIIDERGDEFARKLLTARDPGLEFRLDTEGGRARPAAPAFGTFLRLGLTHIWTGYDHLVFLAALLVACRTTRAMVVIVSSFTLAHSLTLALATLHLINFPPRFTEVAIAASIVFVGVENLWRSQSEPRGRWLLAFAFGLVHGLGFANVLRDLGVGRDGRGILLPLFGFNLGVELGQLIIAAVILPLLWRVAKNEVVYRKSAGFFSMGVSAVGLYWLLERLWFA